MPFLKYYIIKSNTKVVPFSVPILIVFTFHKYTNVLINGPVGIEVYDITGKLVIKVKEGQTAKGLNQINVSFLPTGVYNFSVTYEGRITTAKVLKR